MNTQNHINRRTFLKTCNATAAAAWLSPRLEAAEEEVRLKSWELVEFPSSKRNPWLKLTATNGAVGYGFSMEEREKGIAAAAEVAKGISLLNHDQLYDLMMAKNLPRKQVVMLDIACWDLHARMLKQPLHALLGTKRTKVLRYGDVRPPKQGVFSPQQYADNVARYLESTGMRATKIRFPGNLGTPESISFPAILETLQAVRRAVGKETILGWDPYPGGADSATKSLGDARQILRLMDELGYTWIEDPLPATPDETQIPQYVELVKTGTKQRIMAEASKSSFAHGMRFEDMKRWAEAGAITQACTDAYINTGVTNCLRMLKYAKAHPPLVISPHWAWAPHAHLAMAYDEKVFPLVDFPMGEDVPKEFMSGPWLLAPD